MNPYINNQTVTNNPISRVLSVLKWQVPSDGTPYTITVPMLYHSSQESFSLVDANTGVLLAGASIDNVIFLAGGVQMDVTLPNGYGNQVRLRIKGVGNVSQDNIPNNSFRDQIDVLISPGTPLQVVQGPSNLDWINLNGPNEGQVKLNTGNGIKPTYTWGGGIGPGTWQQITYASPLGLSNNPTTQWPQNVDSPSEDDLYDFVNDTFLENPILGQVNLWRVILNYSGKPGNIAAGVEFRVENTLSGFTSVATNALPRTSTSGTVQLLIVTIGDAASIPAPIGSGQGYEFALNTTDDMTIEVDSIVRINYQKKLR